MSQLFYSIGESDSYDAESGFDETETADVATTVTKFVSRFVDKVCSEGGVTNDHIRSLHQMVPGVCVCVVLCCVVLFLFLFRRGMGEVDQQPYNSAHPKDFCFPVHHKLQ